MRFRIPLASGALALGLIVTGGRPAAAQDVTPPVSRDTSKAEKVRADTLKPDDANAKDVKAYRAMGTPENCVPVAAGVPANRAPGDTNVTRIGDTLNVAAAPATPDSAANRAAEAAGVYRPEKKADVPCPPADTSVPADSTTAAPSDTTSAAPGVNKGVESGAIVRPDSVVKPTPDAAGAVVR
jgi:hypothetical protein